MKVYYWPDYFWCLGDTLEAHLGSRSDDVGTITLPDENHYEDWQIDMMVKEKLDGKD